MNKFLTFIRSRNLVPIILIYYSVGLVGMIIPVTRSLFQALTPFSLLFSILILFLFHDSFRMRFWILATFIFVAGIGVEIIGVSTGLVFGEYTYGETLGLKLFHTPLLIGVNWLMLVYCSLFIVGKFVETPYFRAIGAAVLMVVYDFALEPAAMYLDMWNWNGGAVPLQNYLAWALIAFVLNYAGAHFRLTARENKIAQPLFFIQLGFFIGLDIWILVGGIWDLS